MNAMEAIAREEGFHLAHSRACRNNNPGNIVFEPWTEEFGAILEVPFNKEAARFADFRSVTDGWEALKYLLNKDYAGMTIEAFINKYAPSSENSTAQYIANFCKWTGVSPHDILTPALIG